MKPQVRLWNRVPCLFQWIVEIETQDMAIFGVQSSDYAVVMANSFYPVRTIFNVVERVRTFKHHQMSCE